MNLTEMLECEKNDNWVIVYIAHNNSFLELANLEVIKKRLYIKNSVAKIDGTYFEGIAIYKHDKLIVREWQEIQSELDRYPCLDDMVLFRMNKEYAIDQIYDMFDNLVNDDAYHRWEYELYNHFVSLDSDLFSWHTQTEFLMPDEQSVEQFLKDKNWHWEQ